jgi:hypothetical protein
MGFFGEIANIFENGISTDVFNGWGKLWKEGAKLTEKEFSDEFNAVKAWLINTLTLVIFGFFFFIALLLIVL